MVSGGGLTGHVRGYGKVLGADRVQEVRVATESITVLRYSRCLTVVVLELFCPLVCVVMTLGALESGKHRLVIVNDFGKSSDSVGSI